jgi:hypothetical protein
MIKGHLDQARKNQRSTQPKLPPTSPTPTIDLDSFPEAPADGARSHFSYAAVFEPTGQIYTNQTGKFVSPSSNGNNYLMILYDYDSNTIDAEPMKNRTGPKILKAYQALHQRLCTPPTPR